MEEPTQFIPKMKPISFIPANTQECQACYGPINHNTQIVECWCCHQQLHRDCQLSWIVQSIMNDNEPTCPFCRAVWRHGSCQYYPQ
jgi:hypothetical protein